MGLSVVAENKDEVERCGLPVNIEWLWLEDGNHDLKQRVKSGFSQQAHLQRALEFIKKALAKCWFEKSQ